MLCAFRIRPVELEGVSTPVDEEVEVVRPHSAGRSEVKLPHTLLPEVVGGH